MSVPEPIEVRKVPLHHVSDASELAKLIDDGVLEADRVVAVIGKTEGNGGVNDYTRILADRAFREVLTAKGSRGAAAVSSATERRLVRSGEHKSSVDWSPVRRGAPATTGRHRRAE
jgi:ring-opening amidohydrolase-like protein